MADNDIRSLHREVIALREAVAEHRVRLENGSHVFQKYDDRFHRNDERVKEIEDKIAPKPPSVYKIVGITLSVVLAGAGALWALANMLRDRPTVEQIEKIIHKHDEVGHKSVREDVREIQKEQGAQRVIIEGVKSEQQAANVKLDQILEHAVPRWRRNPP